MHASISFIRLFFARQRCLPALAGLALCTLGLSIRPAIAQTRTALPDFDQFPVYEDQDLGLRYSAGSARIRVWAPSAKALRWRLYTEDLGGTPVEEMDLRKGANGSWSGVLPGNWKGYYYTVQAQFDTAVYGAGSGEGWRNEVPDPYAIAVGRNGWRGQIIDPAEAIPEPLDGVAWAEDQRPALEQPTDAVLYEGHVRDLTIHPSSGVQHKGKFLGLAERGTRSPEGARTGLDYLVELGISHLHLLPFFDYGSLDETKNGGTYGQSAYNWGYDPLNYNTPEGTYCTDPADGAARIRECRRMVQALHAAGIGVVMDVVYNHTYDAGASVFEQIVPGYYYRQNADGSLSNASGCGNETASERPMVRHFMRWSVRHWAEAYHLDGFRFDLMAIHDQETMRAIRADMDAIDPQILLYGEGWTAGPSPLPEEDRALKRLTFEMPGIAAFSDDFRDGIKGHWADEHDAGFASGADGLAETVKAGLSGGVGHPDVDYSRVNYSKTPWAAEPGQSVHYVSCHDNHTLFDKLLLAAPQASPAERLAMQRLSLGLVLCAQGIPFLHAGTEMARTKGGDHNSYKSPDAVNAVNWNRLEDYADLHDYVQGLIQLRREHPVFRIPEAEELRRALRFEAPASAEDAEHRIRLHLDGSAVEDAWSEVYLLINATARPWGSPLPEGPWTLVSNGRLINAEGLLRLEERVEVAPWSMYILVR